MTYSLSLYNTLHAIGLYETLCFAGTTESTYVFMQDDRPRFRNRQGIVLSKDATSLWNAGLVFNV